MCPCSYFRDDPTSELMKWYLRGNNRAKNMYPIFYNGAGCLVARCFNSEDIHVTGKSRRFFSFFLMVYWQRFCNMQKRGWVVPFSRLWRPWPQRGPFGCGRGTLLWPIKYHEKTY